MWLVTLLLIEGLIVAMALAGAWALPRAWAVTRSVAWESGFKPAYWVWSVWHDAAVDLRTDEIAPYPTRGSEWVLQIVLSELSSQHARADALDGKLGVFFAVAAALASLVAGGIFSQAATPDAGIEPLRVAAVALFVLAMVHAFRGMVLRRYYGVPDTTVVRAQLVNQDFSDSDVSWAAVTSVEDALVHNEIILHPKLAAYRVAGGVLFLGISATVGLGVTRLWS